MPKGVRIVIQFHPYHVSQKGEQPPDYPLSDQPDAVLSGVGWLKKSIDLEWSRNDLREEESREKIDLIWRMTQRDCRREQ